MLTFLRNLFAPPAPTARRSFRRSRPARRKAWARQGQNGPRHSGSLNQQHARSRFWRGGNGKATGTSLRRGEILAWHGTSSLENAKSIVAHGWVVGNGNALGDGVYAASDFAMAKGYAGSTGYVLRLAIKSGKTATWSSSLQAAFASWCSRQRCSPDMSAKTAFLLNQGFQTLREGQVIVVLLRGFRNPLAAKIRTRRVRVLSAVSAANGKEIDVGSLMRS